VIEAALRPRGPYSLRQSARLAGDATRTIQGGRLTAVLDVDGRLELAAAWQRRDGIVVCRAQSEDGIDAIRFALGLDDDHTPFLTRFADDPLIGRAVRKLRGVRPVRLGTVTQALLRAVCGQLITAREARGIERRIIREAMPEFAGTGLHAPPTPAAMARFSPAELRRFGLGIRRATALVRLTRALDLEGLRGVPTAAAADRLERERGLGPWSVGVICLQGLGRYERGLVGDLGLIKLVSALRGRWAEAWETAELLEPYGEWQGLASVYLLSGFHEGLIPLAPRAAA
jgi:3-methyladenine DNA glycosylase/8-oxoguanine DNA glycosylase